MKILKNRTTLGIACIVLSLLICFGLTPMFNKAVANKVRIVRLVKDINVGEEITSNVLQIIEVGGYNLPDAVIKNKHNVIGKYATTDMRRGDYILSSKLSSTPLVEYGYLEDFTGEKRAISVTLRNFASGLSGKLQNGDIVSVYVAEYGDRKQTLSPIELKYVEVLAVTLGTGYDASQTEIEDGEEKESPTTITLKAAEKQAIMLADLEANGKIHLAFVYRGNSDNAKAFLVKQDESLRKLEELDPNDQTIKPTDNETLDNSLEVESDE